MLLKHESYVIIALRTYKNFSFQVLARIFNFQHLLKFSLFVSNFSCNGGFRSLRCTSRHRSMNVWGMWRWFHDNEDIDINYDVFKDEDVVEGNVQEFGIVNSQKGLSHHHPSKFVSRTFHIFTRRLYIYKIYQLQHVVEATNSGVFSAKASFA